MKLVLLGPPGSGKGTMAPFLVKKTGAPQIAMGDILREAVRGKTALGTRAAEYIDNGKLVPDEITIGITKEKLSSQACEKGFILDGFPRNFAQAQALEEILAELKMTLDKVVYFSVPLDLVVDRLTGRRSCSACGAVYHVENIPPKLAGKCDVCGGELYQRKDDKKEIIEQRFRVYEQQTAPLIEFYKNKGSFVSIDASQGVEKTLENLMGVLELT